MKKKVLSVIIVVLILSTQCLAWYASPSGWASDSVHMAFALGLVPEGMDCDYNKPITRAEFCRVVCALNGAWAKRGQSAPMRTLIESRGLTFTENTFSDTRDEYVDLCAAFGIAQGDGKGSFNPNSPISRQEAAVLLYRAAEELTYLTISGTAGSTDGLSPGDFPHVFTDGSLIHKWARFSVSWVYRCGIMEGTGNNMFSPNGSYTREQTYVTALRLYYLNGRSDEGAQVLSRPQSDLYPDGDGYFDSTLTKYTKDEASKLLAGTAPGKQTPEWREFAFEDEYDIVIPCISGRFICEKDGILRLYSADGKALSESFVSMTEAAAGGYLGIRADGQRVFLNDTGREILTFPAYAVRAGGLVSDGGGVYAIMAADGLCAVFDAYGEYLSAISDFTGEAVSVKFESGLLRISFRNGRSKYYSPFGKFIREAD